MFNIMTSHCTLIGTFHVARAGRAGCTLDFSFNNLAKAVVSGLVFFPLFFVVHLNCFACSTSKVLVRNVYQLSIERLAAWYHLKRATLVSFEDFILFRRVCFEKLSLDAKSILEFAPLNTSVVDILTRTRLTSEAKQASHSFPFQHTINTTVQR